MELFFALAGIIFVLWIIWRKRHLSTFKRLGIPGPEPNLLFGNIIELYRKGSIKCHEEWVKKYGRVLGYFYGMKPVLLVTDPEILKNVFVRDFQKFINREPFNPIFEYNPKDKYGQSVLTLPGKKWKNVRSILTPTFTAAKMKQMAGSMNSSIETMINVLKENAKSGNVFDVMDVYQRVTMDVITRTAFGIRTDVQTKSKSKILKISQLLFGTHYRDPLVFIGLCFPYIKKLCRDAQELVLALKFGFSKPNVILRKGIRTVIEHRRNNPQAAKSDLLQLMIDSKIPLDGKEVETKHLEIGNSEYEAKFNVGETSNKSFRNMEDNEVISSSFTVLLAGYETTSTALSFTTYLLAKHQEVQEKLYDEINALIQDGQSLEYGTISKLQYLDKVFNESLRIYPPVHLFNNRYAVEDVQYGDFQIPKGMLIQAPVYLMHHDPEFWEDPKKFDPERFENKMNMNGISYLPFGVGPRNCLGMRFAQLEAKLVLAHIIHKFKITLQNRQEDLKFLYKIRTLAPQNGIQVKMELRVPEED